MTVDPRPPPKPRAPKAPKFLKIPVKPPVPDAVEILNFTDEPAVFDIGDETAGRLAHHHRRFP